MNSFIQDSRESWESNSSTEHIVAGCMQRIALATEKSAAAAELMSRNHQQLVNDKEYYQNRCKALAGERDALHRRVSALKGVITKKDKLIAALEEQERVMVRFKVLSGFLLFTAGDGRTHVPTHVLLSFINKQWPGFVSISEVISALESLSEEGRLVFDRPKLSICVKQP